MLCEDFAAALHKLPSFAYGYTPARPRVLNLFTYQFLHEGWLHLIFNMWFLWLVGCYVEDAWGRVLFPAFYLTAGLIAAFSHQAVTPDSSGPLIGASGAVAGAMGAFLVRFLRTNIRFWYFVWLIRPFLGFFYAPAFVMLPLWLGTQVFSAFSGSGDGVAYAAHVGGFVFGVIVALAVKWSGHEKLVDHLVEKQLSWTQDPRLLAAGTHIDTGELDTAITMLEQLAREQPMQVDIQLELLRAAKAKRDPELEARAYAGCARAYMPQLPDKAVEMFYEAVQHDRALAMPRELVLRIGRYLASQGATERAVDVFSALHVDGGIDAPALHALIAHGDLAFAVGDRATAADLFERASAAPHPHTELESMLQKKLTAARS
jgi:membrane associated rhomboid family serine protease